MHHLDAYVFRDEIEYWCKKNYDYIGAPIYEYDGTITPKNYICVGNGGFSMHKISSALRVLKDRSIVYSISELNKWYFAYNLKGRFRYFRYYVYSLLGFTRRAKSGQNNLKVNEDIFWGKYVNQSFDWYNVAPFEEAFKFSMEYNCEELLELNSGQLPFGTHQWFKGDFYSFWVEKNEAIDI